MAAALPGHIAFIMDGNGRWARGRRLPRINGHERGARTLRTITEYCAEKGVKEITFFALSTENYTGRPKTEIRALMKLLVKFLRSERETIRRNDIRLRAIGRVEELPENVQMELRSGIEESSGNGGMILRLALNYGSRQEIHDAMVDMAGRVARGDLTPEAIAKAGPDALRCHLDDPDMRDPDLLIRTSGEFRISNFLLWQSSYTELYFSDVAWPEFTVEKLDDALAAYRERDRKFGKIKGAQPVEEGTVE